MRNIRTKVMVEAALLVALGVVLSRLQFAIWPQGGSITVASMAPIVLLSLRRGYKWGLLGGVAHCALQIMFDGVMAPPVPNLFWYVVVILVDYVIAYVALGFADLFARPFAGKQWAPAMAALSVTGIRYLCHITSGLVIWGVYAPDTMPVWVYSTLYNGTYMVPEMIITTTAVSLLYPILRDKIKS